MNKEKAIENHKRGFNCAQSVACVYSEKLNVPEKDLFQATEALGFGMGAMEICGAVSAMAVIVGFSKSDGDLQSPKTKKESYKAMKSMIESFREKNKSVICRELKGVETGKVLRSCDGCIEDAIQIIDETLF